jgi:hypothetical protein
MMAAKRCPWVASCDAGGAHAPYRRRASGPESRFLDNGSDGRAE